jgi:hypothetical protein
MKCPHLIKWLSFACKAQEKLYFPSPFQIQEYCKRKYHKRCPFYSDNAHAEEIEHVGSAAHP